MQSSSALSSSTPPHSPAPTPRRPKPSLQLFPPPPPLRLLYPPHEAQLRAHPLESLPGCPEGGLSLSSETTQLCLCPLPHMSVPTFLPGGQRLCTIQLGSPCVPSAGPGTGKVPTVLTELNRASLLLLGRAAQAGPPVSGVAALAQQVWPSKSHELLSRPLFTFPP